MLILVIKATTLGSVKVRSPYKCWRVATWRCNAGWQVPAGFNVNRALWEN